MVPVLKEKGKGIKVVSSLWEMVTKAGTCGEWEDPETAESESWNGKNEAGGKVPAELPAGQVCDPSQCLVCDLTLVALELGQEAAGADGAAQPSSQPGTAWSPLGGE